MNERRYIDRDDAGRVLSRAVAARCGDLPEPIVLALPRGGVPVGRHVAESLTAPLDLMLVGKLGVPGHEELAFGAVASGDVRVLNDDVVRAARLDEATIEERTRTEIGRLHEQAAALRGERPVPDVAGRTVILVDDGMATGATMSAALRASRHRHAAAVVVAVCVAPPQVIGAFEQDADAVVCPLQPASFRAVGQWYERFGQVSNEQVRSLLQVDA